MARELHPDPTWDVLYREGIASYSEISQKTGTLFRIKMLEKRLENIRV